MLGNWSYAPPPHFLFKFDIVRSFLNQSDFVTIRIAQCYLSTNENITIILLVPILACVVLTNPHKVSNYNLVNCVVTIYSLANCAIAIYNSQTEFGSGVCPLSSLLTSITIGYSNMCSRGIFVRGDWLLFELQTTSQLFNNCNNCIKLNKIVIIIIIFTHREMCILRLDRLRIFIGCFWFIHIYFGIYIAGGR